MEMRRTVTVQIIKDLDFVEQEIIIPKNSKRRFGFLVNGCKAMDIENIPTLQHLEHQWG